MFMYKFFALRAIFSFFLICCFASTRAQPSSTYQGALAGTTPVFNSVDAIRAQTGRQTPATLYLAETGREGYFTISAEKLADNGGTVVKTRGGVIYKRQFQGPVSVMWFGAKGDGTTNDSDAFAAAIACNTNAVYVPFTPNGYRIANVAVSQTVTIRGENKFNSKILPAFENSSCFITQAEFVEYRDLYFDASRTKNTIGIEHKHRIATISNCFFSGFRVGVHNSNQFVAGGKPDEQTIENSRFRDCATGILSEGHFINSRIINSIFHGCGSAIHCFDESFGASTTTTEGLTIDGCLIYASGDQKTNRAAIQITNLDFTYIRNCMVDLNNYTALSLTNAKFCNISNSYFSTATAGKDASGLVLAGNCSNTSVLNCQLFDNQAWGIEIVSVNGRFSDKLRITNCTARLNKKGDLMVDGGVNINLDKVDFLSNTNSSVLINTSTAQSVVNISNSTITGAIIKQGRAAVNVKD